MLKIKHIVKTFKDNQLAALNGFSLEVPAQQLITLLGESGCGKTTLLRVLSGLETPEEGSIRLGSKYLYHDGTSISPCQRDIAMVFQGGALFPHLKVHQNVAFGLPKLPKKERRDLVQEHLQRVGLSTKYDQYPHQLSGGERQRVALARALAPQPKLLLLDEPFANLDTGMRAELRIHVRELLKSLKCTAILVSHDPADARSFGDRCVIMRAGKMEKSIESKQIFSSKLDCYCEKLLSCPSAQLAMKESLKQTELSG